MLTIMPPLTPSVAARSKPAPHHDQKGFSMLELVVTLAILSILVNFATPSFVTAMKRSSLSTTFSSVSNSIRTARSEAIKRSSGVTMCAVDNSGQCGGANWGNGWLIFTDSRNDGVVGQKDAADVIISTSQDVEPSISVAARQMGASGLTNTGTIRFSATGQSDWTLGTFEVCDLSGQVRPFALVVTAAGTLRNIEATTDSAGSRSVKDPAGDEVCG